MEIKTEGQRILEFSLFCQVAVTANVRRVHAVTRKEDSQNFGKQVCDVQLQLKYFYFQRANKKKKRFKDKITE